MGWFNYWKKRKSHDEWVYRKRLAEMSKKELIEEANYQRKSGTYALWIMFIIFVLGLLLIGRFVCSEINKINHERARELQVLGESICNLQGHGNLTTYLLFEKENKIVLFCEDSSIVFRLKDKVK